MTGPQPLAVVRDGYRITWDGGRYAQGTLPGVGIIGFLDMARPDGTIPPVSRPALRAVVDTADLEQWHRTARLRTYNLTGVLR